MKPARVTLALLAALALGAATAAASALQVSELSLARMARPLIGGSAAPLTQQELLELDQMGNRDGSYDVGDIRHVLYAHPELIPTGIVQTDRAAR